MDARHLSVVSCAVFGCASLLAQTSVTIGGTVGSGGVTGSVNVSTPATVVSVIGSVTSGVATGVVTAVPPTTPPRVTTVTPVTPVDPTIASSSDARITNLSTRAHVASDSPLITGFALTGSGPRTVLVRAVGPTLAAFGVADTLAAPRLKLHDATGAVMLENAGWSGNPMLAPATAVAGAFPLPAGSADSAVVVTLPPGTYSVEVSDDAGRGGVVLTEIYDVEKSADGSHLTNVSTRNNVAPAGGEFISGFIVSGTQPRQFLVRGVGPGLTRFNVGGVLRDPALTLFDSAGVPVATNDNWSGVASVTAAAAAPIAIPVQVVPTGNATASAQTAATVAQAVAAAAAGAAAAAQAAAVAAVVNPITTATARAGAFSLDLGSADAALVVTLNPGAYTVQVNGTNATSGIALLEIYELP